MILKIVQVGDPVLRKRARALAPDEIGSPRITELIEMMRDTMRDAPGVGLAAPQIGVSLQLAVIEDTTHGMSAEALAIARADMGYLDRLLDAGTRDRAMAVALPRASDVVGMIDHHRDNCVKLYP